MTAKPPTRRNGTKLGAWRGAGVSANERDSEIKQQHQQDGKTTRRAKAPIRVPVQREMEPALNADARAGFHAPLLSDFGLNLSGEEWLRQQQSDRTAQ